MIQHNIQWSIKRNKFFWKKLKETKNLIRFMLVMLCKALEIAVDICSALEVWNTALLCGRNCNKKLLCQNYSDVS